MTTSQLVFDPFSQTYYAHPYDSYRELRDEAPVFSIHPLPGLKR